MGKGTKRKNKKKFYVKLSLLKLEDSGFANSIKILCFEKMEQRGYHVI